jgi:AcrR family transcriptional regulator
MNSTQEKILRTSLPLFFKYGIRYVTMDEIARQLGISKKTIYQYYKEKDDLVNQLCDIEVKAQQIKFDDLAEKAADPVQEIMMISGSLKRMMENINPTFFKDLQKFYPQAYKRFQQFREQCTYKNILANVKKGKRDGYYRKDLDVEFTAQYRLAQIDMLIFGEYFNYEKTSFAKAHELVLEMFLYGICSVKGHSLVEQYKSESY